VLRIVEIPDDTVPSAWAPQLVALSSRGITPKTNYRLLANNIAHQWWGVTVSPASRNDWWIEDGFARYSEARYIETAAGQGALQEAVKDMSVGALAYDTVPLSSAGKLDLFSPEFQSLVTDKGAMILHMLRWVMGDQKFDQAMRDFYAQYAGKSATVDDFREVVEKDYGQKLTWFFSQWLDSTGAPEFKTKYTIYRLGNNKGFRVVGQIAQDLDLFRMPVELKIDTDGKTETKRVDVTGTDSAFSVDTFGRPRRISIDPQNWLLKNSPDIRLRAGIQRGQALVQQGDLAGALSEFNKALDINKNSSLAHYRIAEVFFLQHNYQASANAYRDSLNGDGDPRWTEVWSHIQLGKIFDTTGQRERATNEYRQALQTNDNTAGAMDEARRYLQKAYEAPKGSSEGQQ
jgi:tetratricopeptide (TPR) repeat protein